MIEYAVCSIFHSGIWKTEDFDCLSVVSRRASESFGELLVSPRMPRGRTFCWSAAVAR